MLSPYLHKRHVKQSTEILYDLSALMPPTQFAQDPLEPSPLRVERPPADEEPPPPPYLETAVQRPVAGIGPEARLAELDERTELKIVVPRCMYVYIP